jgi:bifunctional non-homologous end joining protein LigD
MAEQVQVNGITVQLCHTDKVLFPGDDISKGDLIAYYESVAGPMLPQLADRPVSMARFPDGIKGDRSFDRVRDCAFLVRGLLEDELGMTTFVKTTGGDGLHVHLPLDRSGDFEAARGLAREAAALLAGRHPDLMTTQQRKDSRGDRVYLDMMRNGYAQTAVAPYSVRARPGAPVATPLGWQELDDGRLTPGRFTIATVPGRLAAMNGNENPWAGLARRRYSVSAAAARLARLERPRRPAR